MTLKAKKTKIEFPDSGEVGYFTPYSVAAEILRLQRKHPRPLPPLVEVDMGNGHKAREFNYADPDYPVTIRKWESYAAEMASFNTIEKIRNSLTLNKEQQKDVEEWKTENPGSWDTDDRDSEIWLEQIAIKTDADFNTWMTFVQTGGQPASEEVKAIQDGFQG